MGWEDIRRDFNNCDHDFNDVMFYASWNPVTSVDVDEYVPIDTEEKDYDEDGVTDDQDEYPEDSERAFNNFLLVSIFMEPYYSKIYGLVLEIMT